MKKTLSYCQGHKNIIMILRYLCVMFIIFFGYMAIAATASGKSNKSKGTVDNNNHKPANECTADYDLNPGCNDSNEACSMAIRINADRKANSKESDCAPAIKWNNKLAAIARAHSRNMCKQSTLAHKLNGKDTFDRMADAKIKYVTAGENVAMGTDGVYNVNNLEDGLMNEPKCESNHRGNILNRDFNYVGIGVEHCDDGNIYITQDFASFSSDDIRNDPNEYCGD
jgi:uncharacterized protein YkwD